MFDYNGDYMMVLCAGADLEGAHPAHAPCSPLYVRPKNKCAPPPPVESDNLYCFRPPGSTFSGSAPDVTAQ